MAEHRISDEALSEAIASHLHVGHRALLDLRDERAENEKLRNVIAALKGVIHHTRSISNKRLHEMIEIARGECS